MNKICLVSIIVCSLGYYVNKGSFEIFISIKDDAHSLIINYECLAITGKSKISAVKTTPTGLLTLSNEEKNGYVARD